LRFKHALQVIGLASIVAVGGITIQPTHVSATDPVPTPSPSPTPTPVATLTATATATTTTVASTTLTVRQRIVRIALRQRYDRYVAGGIGPDAFDCSGLVRYVYRQAGVSRKLGGGHSARMMYLWGLRNHLTSRLHPRLGDVAVWGRGSHVGIYIGNGKAISALNPRQDIRITGIHALGATFTTFIHPRLP
jgi:cell wall-associated NlpC family hydrolase